MLGGRWRSIGNAIGAAIPAQLGHLSLALYVYLVPDLYWLEVILAVSGLACIPYWFLIPESPRWLKVQDRGEESLRVIRKISKMNGLYHNVGDDVINYCLDDHAKCEEKQQQDEMNNNQSKVKMAKKYPALCRNMLVCTLLWFSFNIGFYGMVYNTPPLDFSPQMVFAFPAFFTLPIVAISPVLENKLGRKALIIFPLGLAGITAMLTLAIPYER